MRQPHLAFPTCLVCALAAACARGDAPPAEAADAVVRDSAGIRIVENPEYAPDRTSWSIDTVPGLSIGGNESLGEAYLFGRVMDVLVLGDGRLVVADGQLDAVRMYGPDGTYLRQVGRRGQGPGEYTGVVDLLHLPGDSFAVRSGYGGRALVQFDPAGAYVRSTAPPSLPDDGRGAGFGVSTFVDAFGDGTFLAHVTSNPAVAGRAETPAPVITLAEGVQRLVRVGADGSVTLEYGAFPGRRHLCLSVAQRACGLGLDAPYVPQPHVATAAGRLYFADGARFEIAVYGADGRIERIIRKPATPRTIAFAWADSTRSALADGLAGSPLGGQIARIPPLPVPEHAPPIDALLTDPAGNLWVRSGGPGNAAPPTWFVFDSTGVLTHSLESRVEPLRIGADYVLTAARNEYEVERVEVLPLRKR